MDWDFGETSTWREREEDKIRIMRIVHAMRPFTKNVAQAKGKRL